MIKNMRLPFGVKSRVITLLAAGLFWAGLAQAQESANTSGGDATGSGGTVAYSVGQVVFSINSGSNGSVEQGVQYAYEIFTFVGIKRAELNVSAAVFPNPTANNLSLQISDYNKEKLSYQLFDMNGKQLGNGQIVAQQTKISMKSLPTATYFFNILNQENKKVQSFKIIKK